ncbi:MAG TPA: SURF1 family cytochrome oxidase biogenesis protein [Caulobacteraceae bacterium]|nr:SURF1 family cytochrome oxidase biogenesis protein [Caulobacteraceae bacterium]
MTGTSSQGRRRFEIVPAIAAVTGIVILIGLGVWQIQRLHWKQAILARVAALQAAPPQPLAALLARAASGEDVDYHRVEMTCPNLETGPYLRLYAVWQGYGGYRLIAACPVAAGPYRAILVDRGFIAQGLTATRGQTLAQPIVGVLRKGDQRNFVTPANEPGANLWYWRDIPAMATALGVSAPAPSFLMLERPAPPPGGPTPAAIPADIPNNHLQYAITWFGLALALAGVYLATLWTRRPRT